jgi:hypothetical protein
MPQRVKVDVSHYMKNIPKMKKFIALRTVSILMFSVSLA